MTPWNTTAADAHELASQIAHRQRGDQQRQGDTRVDFVASCSLIFDTASSQGVLAHPKPGQLHIGACETALAVPATLLLRFIASEAIAKFSPNGHWYL